MVGKRSLADVSKADPPPEGDIERGLRKPKFASFKDAVDMVTADNQRTKIKNKLTDSVDRMRLEKYRKSDEELKSFSSKRVRKFYETQNERLDSWLEVDTLVMSMSGDILGSMDPDRDHDGIAERNGALQGVGGRLDELLPEDAREKRLHSERNARWAINVRRQLCLRGFVHADECTGTGQCHCEYTSPGCQMRGRLLLFIAISDCFLDRLSIRPAVYDYRVDNQQAGFMAD